MLSVVTESVPPNNSCDSFTIFTCEGQIQGNNPNSTSETQQVILSEDRTSNTYWAIALYLTLQMHRTTRFENPTTTPNLFSSCQFRTTPSATAGEGIEQHPTDGFDQVAFEFLEQFHVQTKGMVRFIDDAIGGRFIHGKLI